MFLRTPPKGPAPRRGLSNFRDRAGRENGLLRPGQLRARNEVGGTEIGAPQEAARFIRGEEADTYIPMIEPPELALWNGAMMTTSA